jgi:hypothetical protein
VRVEVLGKGPDETQVGHEEPGHRAEPGLETGQQVVHLAPTLGSNEHDVRRGTRGLTLDILRGEATASGDVRLRLTEALKGEPKHRGAAGDDDFQRHGNDTSLPKQQENSESMLGFLAIMGRVPF